MGLERPLGELNVMRRPLPIVGQRVELARYQLPAGERVLYGQRINGIVRVTDKPASGTGRSFLVERGLEKVGELHALVADYIAESERRGEPAALPALGFELAGLPLATTS